MNMNFYEVKMWVISNNIIQCLVYQRNNLSRNILIIIIIIYKLLLFICPRM